MGSDIVVVLMLGPIAARWGSVFTAKSFFNICLDLHLLVLGEPGIPALWDRSTLHMHEGLVEQSVIIGLVSDPALGQVRAANIW